MCDTGWEPVIHGPSAGREMPKVDSSEEFRGHGKRPPSPSHWKRYAFVWSALPHFPLKSFNQSVYTLSVAINTWWSSCWGAWGEHRSSREGKLRALSPPLHMRHNSVVSVYTADRRITSICCLSTRRADLARFLCLHLSRNTEFLCTFCLTLGSHRDATWWTNPRNLVTLNGYKSLSR
jgi:hypothetical protein